MPRRRRSWPASARQSTRRLIYQHEAEDRDRRIADGLVETARWAGIERVPFMGAGRTKGRSRYSWTATRPRISHTCAFYLSTSEMDFGHPIEAVVPLTGTCHADLRQIPQPNQTLARVGDDGGGVDVLPAIGRPAPKAMLSGGFPTFHSTPVTSPLGVVSNAIVPIPKPDGSIEPFFVRI